MSTRSGMRPRPEWPPAIRSGLQPSATAPAPSSPEPAKPCWRPAKGAAFRVVCSVFPHCGNPVVSTLSLRFRCFRVRAAALRCACLRQCPPPPRGRRTAKPGRHDGIFGFCSCPQGSHAEESANSRARGRLWPRREAGPVHRALNSIISRSSSSMRGPSSTRIALPTQTSQSRSRNGKWRSSPQFSGVRMRLASERSRFRTLRDNSCDHMLISSRGRQRPAPHSRDMGKTSGAPSLLTSLRRFPRNFGKRQAMPVRFLVESNP